MSADEMFNSVIDEAERVTSGKVKYSESWISKLDGEYSSETTNPEVSSGTEAGL
ncbi:Uncharacterised protein [Serratia ficaria]|uniref:hypothetical protein n=1 Tax=Serratia ficaria TaxID=61651 RepID=UPI00217BDC82|nr:hypothetical protein [Serratia ficaria]CAI2080778.1 Uncharacterised protein [Serratia ficaria]CAI2490294.1 Uncharacterised protein [Serratia ficaria]